MTENNKIKIIFIMVDGFGIPPEGIINNSVYKQFCDSSFLTLLDHYTTPVDATLGVSGIPQSATGQSSLFCGINSAKQIGMHLQGFPNARLRELIRGKNIFKALISLGKTVCFANAYVNHTLEELVRIGMRSVTTVMTENELGYVRDHQDLLQGNAVFHDVTRTLANHDAFRHLRRIKNSDKPKKPCPEITPEKAAEDLRNISRQHDFTLFEYFLTDRAGHKRKESYLTKSLGDFSRFTASLARCLDQNQLLIVTSDHGNCEDISIKSHTCNPVPFFVYGRCNDAIPKPKSLPDVYDYVIRSITA